ncbi:unnamed protein product, partial [Heterotrigona itama]
QVRFFQVSLSKWGEETVIDHVSALGNGFCWLGQQANYACILITRPNNQEIRMILKNEHVVVTICWHPASFIPP